MPQQRHAKVYPIMNKPDCPINTFPHRSSFQCISIYARTWQLSANALNRLCELSGDGRHGHRGTGRRTRVASGRAGRDRVVGRDVLGRRHAGPGQVRACGGSACTGERTWGEPVRRRGVGGPGGGTGDGGSLDRQAWRSRGSPPSTERPRRVTVRPSAARRVTHAAPC